MRSQYEGPPMDLANMRANGVRSLSVSCPACHRSVRFNVDAYSAHILVTAFAPRMVCTRCGMIGADARPDWTEYSPATSRTNIARPIA